MPGKNPFLSLDRHIVGDGYTSTEPMDNLLILCDEFGSRFGGTQGERQAAEFFQTKMETYGLRNVHLEPVEYIGWIRGEATLEILSPVKKVIPCISLPHSPPRISTAPSSTWATEPPKTLTGEQPRSRARSC
jgi:hypothetical protein